MGGWGKLLQIYVGVRAVFAYNQKPCGYSLVVKRKLPKL
jgi:hypothetical protein